MKKKSLKKILFIIYVLLLIYVLIKPSPFYYMSYYDYFMRFSNFIPFKTILEYINALLNGTINEITVLKNIVGNIILFIPLIYFIKDDNHTKKRKMFYIYCIALIIGFEFLQLIFKSGSLDIDDLILNFSGIFITYEIYIKLLKKNCLSNLN